MNCPKCNSEIDTKNKFCTKCGYNLEEHQKEEKQKNKTARTEKLYKIKLKIALILFLFLIISILVLIGLNFFGKQSHKSKTAYTNVIQGNNTKQEIIYTETNLENEELTEENKRLDYDEDGLTNEEEQQYGTNMRSSDTDGDGLSDYDEIKRHNSDPTKYSTSGDDISDYIKVERDLEITRKYASSEVKPEEVEINYNIKLIPDDINSQYYGGLKQFSNDTTIKSTYNIFNLLNFKGTVEYDTNNKESILLLKDGNQYSEFKNYKNEEGKLIITITKEDNYKDFVITTKENYENYKNSK